VSTVSTKHLARSETPSSILSSDSDIRFTRKLGAHYRCGCCILAGFLLFLLLAAAAVYLGCKYLLLLLLLLYNVRFLTTSDHQLYVLRHWRLRSDC
jgi:hypothetical protein